MTHYLEPGGVMAPPGFVDLTQERFGEALGVSAHMRRDWGARQITAGLAWLLTPAGDRRRSRPFVGGSEGVIWREPSPG